MSNIREVSENFNHCDIDSLLNDLENKTLEQIRKENINKSLIL